MNGIPFILKNNDIYISNGNKKVLFKMFIWKNNICTICRNEKKINKLKIIKNKEAI